VKFEIRNNSFNIFLHLWRQKKENSQKFISYLSFIIRADNNLAAASSPTSRIASQHCCHSFVIKSVIFQRKNNQNRNIAGLNWKLVWFVDLWQKSPKKMSSKQKKSSSSSADHINQENPTKDMADKTIQKLYMRGLCTNSIGFSLLWVVATKLNLAHYVFLACGIQMGVFSAHGEYIRFLTFTLFDYIYIYFSVGFIHVVVFSCPALWSLFSLSASHHSIFFLIFFFKLVSSFLIKKGLPYKSEKFYDISGSVTHFSLVGDCGSGFVCCT
jgi:hypothetical protein